jgi:hypothetical protein
MDEYPRDVTLLGEFYCRMTSAQINQWTEYALNCGPGKTYVKAKTWLEILKLRQAGTAADLSEDLLEAYADFQDCQQAMYAEGKAWWEDNCKEALEAKERPDGQD